MRKMMMAALAATMLCSSAFAANVVYTGSDTQDGVSISYSITTNGAEGVLLNTDIVGSSISFTGSAGSRYGAFATFTALNTLFLNIDANGGSAVTATANALSFDFSNGGGLNFDFQGFTAADGTQQSFAYALAARGISDGDAVVYGHGDLATRELDNPERDGYNNLGDGTYTVVDPSVQVFAVADVAAVPEPATWALMLTGFGAIGYGLRRRKAAVSFA